MPDSEYTQIDVVLPSVAPPRSQLLGHRRLNSLDAVPEDDMATAWLHDTPGMLSEPQIAAEVSKILGKRVRTPNFVSSRQNCRLTHALDEPFLHI